LLAETVPVGIVNGVVIHGAYDGSCTTTCQ
jgi:hypothetical protein